MASLEELYRLPDDFRSTVRLFPLPNLVLFPHVLQPLHIFEPRYRELMAETIATDMLMGLVMLAPGWENDYEGRPALEPIGCLAKVATYNRLDDGRYNLLVAGLRRMRIKRELLPTKMFREAEIELIEDIYSPLESVNRPNLYRRLLDSFRDFLPRVSELEEQIEQLLSADVPLGTLTDIVAYTLDLPTEAKLQLLTDTCVETRAARLIGYLESQAVSKVAQRPRNGRFPPDFSAN